VEKKKWLTKHAQYQGDSKKIAWSLLSGKRKYPPKIPPTVAKRGESHVRRTDKISLEKVTPSRQEHLGKVDGGQIKNCVGEESQRCRQEYQQRHQKPLEREHKTVLGVGPTKGEGGY